MAWDAPGVRAVIDHLWGGAQAGGRMDIHHPRRIMEKILIVYYSRTGTARQVAQLLAAQSGWALAEVGDVRPRAGFWGDVRCVLENVLHVRASYRYEGPALEDFAHVIAIAPVWMGRLASPMHAFLADQLPFPARLSVVCVMAARGAFNAMEDVARLTSTLPAPVLALLQRDVASGLSQDEISGFIDQVRAAAYWDVSRRRAVWLSPSEA
nr:conserved hypothetical protein [blood disease bacterium R229]